MFGLYESCQLNNVDFGHYIEDILTRIVNGEAIDESEDKSLYATCFPESERFSLINLDK